MPDHPFCSELEFQRTFFLRSTSCFRPQDAGFAPQPGMFSVAAQIAHAAFTVDWFMQGAFRPQGFDMDFAQHERDARSVATLQDALARFTASYQAAIDRFAATSLADLHIPIADGPIMGGAPRLAVASALGDHTAHHRGALTIYARLLGLTPPMPYA